MSILSIMSMSIMSIISTPAFPHRRVFNSASGVAPADARLADAGLTVYSGHMFGRLRKTVPHAVLFGDIGEEAFGKRVR